MSKKISGILLPESLVKQIKKDYEKRIAKNIKSYLKTNNADFASNNRDLEILTKILACL